MSGFRSDTLGRIDRSQPLNFRFDGQRLRGFRGDTLVSALLAGGVQVLGRSFKYHRPRGAWSAWFDDPNALFNVSRNGDQLTNVPGATTPLEDGMALKAVNAFPSARHDLKGGLDLFHRFLVAGFYYKTFMWPNWHWYEPSIRRMAGLGALDGREIDAYASDQRFDRCDVLVVGAGASGLAAARSAAEAGAAVVLVDDHPDLGGALYGQQAIEGLPPHRWIETQRQALEAAGGRILTQTTAFGVYDHQLVALAQAKPFGQAPSLIRMRAKRLLLASGVIDRPLTFANNDRPGVMSLRGASELAARYGVIVGRKILVLAAHSLAERDIELLQAAGAQVERLPLGSGTPQAQGRKWVRGLTIGGQTHACDTVLTSAGLMPVLHLWRHGGGKLDWNAQASAFLPGAGPDWMQVVGSANGVFAMEERLADARAAATGQARPGRTRSYTARPPDPDLESPLRQWVDFQHDVTVKDVALAHCESYVSVEHLKRYTTAGMASDQGKTANVPALSVMAKLRDTSVPAVGTTTFRPPFVPVPFELYRGVHRGPQFHPVKRLNLEALHRAAGAALGEYGGWLRPAWYGEDAHASTQAAAKRARETAAYYDASPLGKIEVLGPDAGAFVNFIYYNTMAQLQPGCLRYGFMLTEGGHVYDDGVLTCFDQNRYLISCSSSHVEGVVAMLEAWRQDGHDPDRIFVHDTTDHWATVTVTGPKARGIVAALVPALDLSAHAFAPMQVRLTQFEGQEVRLARVSFTGDLSFEISIAAAHAATLWQAVAKAGERVGAVPLGMESLAILRAEKGYIVVGKDTDGETMPHDLGFGVPRRKKRTAFIGDRGLHSDAANHADRRVLTGLKVPTGAPRLPDGGHVVVTQGGQRRSCGYITSSYDSPNTDFPIALGLIEAPLATPGTEVEIYHLGQRRTALIAPPCFLDPEGERLYAQ